MSEKETRVLLGQNIRALRTQYAISEGSLANLINVPIRRLKNVEQGQAKLYDIHLRRLAQIFDVSIDSLFRQNQECP